MVAYNNKKYYIDIIESKPSNAITIIETDCEVDFAPPLDYKEPEKPVAPVPLNKGTAQGTDFFIFIAITGPVCHLLSSLIVLSLKVFLLDFCVAFSFHFFFRVFSFQKSSGLI